jgi:hypothetical protein
MAKEPGQPPRSSPPDRRRRRAALQNGGKRRAWAGRCAIGRSRRSKVTPRPRLSRRRAMDGLSLQIGCSSPRLARNFERELAFAKAFALGRRGRNDGRASAFADRTGRGEELLRADAGLSGVLREKPQQFPRLPRQMRRVPSGMPVERLLGKPDRRQGMRLRSAVASRCRRSATPSSRAPLPLRQNRRYA